MIELILPDNTTALHERGTTGRQVADSIGRRLAMAAVAVSVEGVPMDLDRPLEGGGRFTVITDSSEEGRAVMRHSAAHILAQAVLRLFEGSTFAIGPSITDGFYYDFDIGRPFTPEDMEQIEDEMHRIVGADQPFVREELSVEAGLQLFRDHPFKTEIILSVDESEVESADAVSVYRNDDFVDLCRGPHLPSTGRLKAFKLTRTAGAYWRGDANRPQLQRIYGTAWESAKALRTYLHRIEEAARRDHRRLGRELDLFSFPEDLGPGLAVWHPNGGMLRRQVEDYSRRVHEAFGFDFVNSPHLARAELWNTSGHLEFYAENMYPGMEMDGQDEYRVKPMNCPFHVLIYRSSARSYRELPMRLSELGGVYRYERSGVVHGLLRARGFTQDDSHTFCTREQVPSELVLHLDFVLQLLRDFGFEEFEAELATRPEDKWVGDLGLWELAERALGDALVTVGVPHTVAEGEGAFYGPKIDVHVRDAIGRRWQMSTIQVDFSLPERFSLEYVTRADTRERPVMIHSAKFGSVERFLGVLIEHYAGAFPMWLSPVQAVVIPVADRHEPYATRVAESLRNLGLRVERETGPGKLGEKVRRAITRKLPAVLVVGDDDVDSGTVGLRLRGAKRDRRGVPLDEVLGELSSAARPPH
ncbi:MAG: threonine--tRNA ligase [bacterium]|nr:threonine--tRNA ligase [bacterium]MDE0290823.1 threonine--tRNA ligase [bacterium]MDE0438237.1 threonine--tRNA ligase [bacterium]